MKNTRSEGKINRRSLNQRRQARTFDPLTDVLNRERFEVLFGCRQILVPELPLQSLDVHAITQHIRGIRMPPFVKEPVLAVRAFCTTLFPVFRHAVPAVQTSLEGDIFA